MKDKLKAVENFHKKFGLTISKVPTVGLDSRIIKLRHALMKEENNEYLAAAQSNNLEELADALGDMLYILCGTIIAHGMQHKIDAVFTEIQSSNMSKLGTDGKPIYRKDGKILKGPRYMKPDLAKIFDQN